MPMICATKRGGACLLAKGHLCEQRKHREYLCCSSIRCKEAVIHVCKMYLIVSIRFILFVMHIFCACVFSVIYVCIYMHMVTGSCSFFTDLLFKVVTRPGIMFLFQIIVLVACTSPLPGGQYNIIVTSIVLEFLILGG